MADQKETPPNSNSKSKNPTKRRKEPVIFPLGIRTRTNYNAHMLILEFLDAELENEIIASFALTKGSCKSIHTGISNFLNKLNKRTEDNEE
ncbi:hypothetical protein [Parasaccharibacter sp. TMW2.1890]|uniref:hypothetical protein n=1 Tax=Parasaccharibacter sp. TMW2.1890 TaxID=2039289 RepID=UPI0020129BB0|nr:hypothetical protein [Parasaccharibacter sp. TMW2.1890]